MTTIPNPYPATTTSYSSSIANAGVDGYRKNNRTSRSSTSHTSYNVTHSNEKELASNEGDHLPPWRCAICTYINTQEFSACEVCNLPQGSLPLKSDYCAPGSPDEVRRILGTEHELMRHFERRSISMRKQAVVMSQANDENHQEEEKVSLDAFKHNSELSQEENRPPYIHLLEHAYVKQDDANYHNYNKVHHRRSHVSETRSMGTQTSPVEGIRRKSSASMYNRQQRDAPVRERRRRVSATYDVPEKHQRRSRSVVPVSKQVCIIKRRSRSRSGEDHRRMSSSSVSSRQLKIKGFFDLCSEPQGESDPKWERVFAWIYAYGSFDEPILFPDNEDARRTILHVVCTRRPPVAVVKQILRISAPECSRTKDPVSYFIWQFEIKTVVSYYFSMYSQLCSIT